MASLNLSINGPSIKSSYNSIATGPPPPAASPTHAQWALFSVQAPLANAFQDSGAKESILKVEATGEGELTDLVEDFSEGRVQFAFVKVKDPNTALPKCVLIAWCGGGVPERTKGYFTSHTAAVAKVLHGYHVQITARSNADLEPEAILKKVSDASGAKYSAANPGSAALVKPPSVKSKPVFTPTAWSSSHSTNPLVTARSWRDTEVDEDGWGADAPPVARTEIQKVESAYRPTKVNMAEFTKQKSEPSRFNGSSVKEDKTSDVVKGGYQPVGKVDIAAIRAAARNQEDDRPTPVKGAYEPICKVDMAAIRAKAQKPTEMSAGDTPTSHLFAERAANFNQLSQSDRVTSPPKVNAGNSFAGASKFTGKKMPIPSGLGFGASGVTALPVGSTSRTFADEGGKTPAQVWAEKKARQGGSDTNSAITKAPATSQKSGAGEWKSGYTGKTWAPVQTSGYSRTGPESVSQQNTGEYRKSVEGDSASSGGVSALRDHFKNVRSVGSPTAISVPRAAEHEPSPAAPPVPENSRPSDDFALPELLSRPSPPNADGDDDHQGDGQEREPSPVLISIPVPRTEEEVRMPSEHPAPPRVPPNQVDVPGDENLPDESEDTPVAQEGDGWVADQAPPQAQAQEAAHMGEQGGRRALVQYDYEKAEDNEIDLVDGEYITDIDMVDEDWWMGRNSEGKTGLFPSNYVVLVDEDRGSAATLPPTRSAAEPTHDPGHSVGAGPVATALYDYEAAEDNELSFSENAKITNLEFPDEDWWFGHCNGASGLFPANYVELDP